MKKLLGTVVMGTGLLVGSLAHAAIIDNGTYTTDTTQGLDYLDVGLLFNDYTTFESGVSYMGRTWTLATAEQLASTWSDITGLSLTTTDIYSGDNDMGSTATNALVSLFDGVAGDVGVDGEAVIGDYTQNEYYNFMAGGQLAVHTVYDDSHFISGLDGTRSAWLVSSVPEPGSMALLGLGLAGLFASRRRKTA